MTALVARTAFPKGTLAMQIRDALGGIYRDEQFAPLFAKGGQRAEAPWRLALTLVLQFVEGLGDRQAADAVRGRVDWKYALGLELTDTGFDFSVLSEFRDRLLAGGAEEHLLTTLLQQCQEHGWLAARGRQRTDSTHVVAAVRALQRLELVQETLRHALDVLATVAPVWLRERVPSAWRARYGGGSGWTRLPEGETARQVLAEQIGADGQALLGLLRAADAPTWLREVPAVQAMAAIWAQQYGVLPAPTAGTPTIHWRSAEELPAVADQIVSPHDPDVRWGAKRDLQWAGAKAHLTETADPSHPHLIVHVETTPASTPDSAVTERVHAALAAKDRLPDEHLVDTGYVDAGQIVASQRDHQVDLVGPVPLDTSWQNQTPGAYTTEQFVVDWTAQTVTCPEGQSSRTWQPGQDRHGSQVVRVAFARAGCLACPARVHCTTAQTCGRKLTLRPQAEYDALQTARHRQATPAFRAAYAARAGIEGTIAQAIQHYDLRHARYRGLAKLHLQHLLTAVAINRQRLTAWLAGAPRAATRCSPFATLA